MPPAATYRLLDCGAGRRLEAIGALVVDRPAPTANDRRLAPGRWAGATMYRAGKGWAAADGSQPPSFQADVAFEGVTLSAHLGPGGQIGFYPEHAANAPWLRAVLWSRTQDGPVEAPAVLNLFAHSGLLSLVAASAGAAVTHVDASRPAVQAARGNARRSTLEAKPIRWLVDDAVAFVRREGRRGRRYTGVILDPPSYGHGTRGSGAAGRRFEDGIDELIADCLAVAAPGAFWIVTTHSPTWDAHRLASVLEQQTGTAGGRAERRALEIQAESGARLRLGAAALLDPLQRNAR